MHEDRRMKIDAQRKLRLRQSLFVALLALIVLAVVLGVTSRGQWNIPEEARRRPNPVQPSAQALDAARNIYKDRCAHCHGDTGKGDGPDAWKHLTTPTDFTDARRMSALTDGELFYQISEGRRPMPAFKTRLTEEQRWQLVLLIRSFARSAD
jgi:mono/diheme cytochrome c family protein